LVGVDTWKVMKVWPSSYTPKSTFKKAKIMASAPVTSRQIDGEIMETVIDCIFLCSKITVDDDCSHEIKRCLLIGRKAMTKPRQHIKKAEISLC